MNNYQPLLNVYLIWHPEADGLCRPLAKAVYTCLNRDPNRPFARGIGIPTYYRCTPEVGKEIPLAIDVISALHSVIFVLVEDHLVNDDAWADAIAGLYRQTKSSHRQHLLVPVALSKSAFNLHPDVAETNFVRLLNLDADAVKPKLLHYILHILARLLANHVRTTEQGIKLSPLPIKLFISHTKREPKALQLAEALKQELDNTQVGRFFDSVDIASGENFADEIEGNIKNAAVMAIRSDRYSDSPWCRMEVMATKRLNRPMIVIDALQQHEARSFPYLSNVPCIRFDLEQSLDTPEARQKLHAIIDFALLEVLRFIYVEKHFAHLKASDWLPQEAFMLSRPPEERDLRTSKLQHVVYPDPPLGYEENAELNTYNIQLNTPTTWRGKSLQMLSIGISISETDAGELQALGLSEDHLQNTMLEIARQCLAQGATLVYGGDLRPNGFTENLLELVRYHNDALKKEYKPVVNYLAWPLKSTLDTGWTAKNKDALKVKVMEAPADLKQAGLIQDSVNGADSSVISGYVWARCLTVMREEIVEKTQARIMMGGRTLGFKGKYPGLVEEALITLTAKKPLFLLGGYGGASRAICLALQGQQPEQLTEQYQCSNSSYANLLREFNQKITEQQLAIAPINYETVVNTFVQLGISGLNNGLTEDENLILFTTINHEEAIGLILAGLSRIKA